MRPLFDNRAFIDWLAAQNPEQSYEYTNCKQCLIAQYLRCRGFPHVFVDSDRAFLRRYGMDRRELPSFWNEIAQQKPWTVGAALARAREALER